MVYLKEEIDKMKNNMKETQQERMINRQIYNYIDLILDYLNCQSNKITITIHSNDKIVYENRNKIVSRLQSVFPSMKVSEQYTYQDQEYYDVTFDWN